jgi:hypothetical protein
MPNTRFNRFAQLIATCRGGGFAGSAAASEGFGLVGFGSVMCEGYRGALHLAARASDSVQNHRSPFDVSIWVWS